MKTSVFVGTSLDGFIARPNGAFDFLDGPGTGGSEPHGYEEFFATVDAVVMGRMGGDRFREAECCALGGARPFVHQPCAGERVAPQLKRDPLGG